MSSTLWQREVRRQIDAGIGSFEHAHLNEIDLSGIRIKRASFAATSLRGASLRGATLVHVDLTGADLLEADLEGASFQMCAFGGAVAARASARRSMWHQCLMTGTRLEQATLRGALLDGCDLRGANLARADLAAATLSGCQLGEANLAGANLRWATTSACDIMGADLRGARRFFMCRDFVAEVFDRHAGRGTERRTALGMIRGETRWCYREWRDHLADHPDLHMTGLEIFDLYPESGCREALEQGWTFPARLELGATPSDTDDA